MSIKKVSVVIPTYNVELYIKQCLESVVNQTLSDIEIICVDDGSVDETVQILKEYQEKYPNKIKTIFNTENVSTSQCRKQGVGISNGEYVMFLDSDDYYELDACEVAYNAIKDAKIDIVHFGMAIDGCDGISEQEIIGAQKFTSPYLSEILYENLLSACFIERKFEFTLWNKIIKGDLCRIAFNRVEDGYFSIAEDCYAIFICLDLAQSYKGIDNLLYHYCLGRGGTKGTSIISYENFTKTCQSVFVCRALRRYASGRESNSKTDYIQIIENLEKRFLWVQCNKWFYNLQESEKLRGFDFLSTVWDRGVAYILSALANMFYSNRSEIAKALKNSQDLTYYPRKTKTLAFHYARIYNGGIERVITEICNTFAEYKIDGVPQYKVILVTDEHSHDNDYPLCSKVIREYVPHFSLFPKNDYYERAQVWYDIIEKYKVDIVLNSSWVCPTALWDMLTIKTHPNHPAYINHTHGFCAILYKYSNLINQMWDMYNIADGIVTLSYTDRRFWSHINPKSYYIPNFCYLSASKEHRAKYKSRTILWVGRLVDGKQSEDIVKIMKYVVQKVPDAVCRIVGTGDLDVENNLLRLITTENLSNCIWLEGYKIDPRKYYQESSVFLSTSRYEGFPSTFFESAAHGLPTVTYDIPWIEYYNIIDGWCTVPQKAPREAAKEIIKLLEDQEYWQEKSDKIFKSFEKFQERDILGEWLQLIKNIEDTKIPEQYIDPKEGILLKEISHFHFLGVIEQIKPIKAQLVKEQKLNKELQSLNKELQSERDSLRSKLQESYNEKWARFGRLSRGRKIWTLGKVLSKKLHLYWFLRPCVRGFRRILKRNA